MYEYLSTNISVFKYLPICPAYIILYINIIKFVVYSHWNIDFSNNYYSEV